MLLLVSKERIDDEGLITRQLASVKRRASETSLWWEVPCIGLHSSTQALLRTVHIYRRGSQALSQTSFDIY